MLSPPKEEVANCLCADSPCAWPRRVRQDSPSWRHSVILLEVLHLEPHISAHLESREKNNQKQGIGKCQLFIDFPIWKWNAKQSNWSSNLEPMAGGQGVAEKWPGAKTGMSWEGSVAWLSSASFCCSELTAIVALNTHSMGYFNGHIALNWAFTICSVPNFECKRNIFHNYICNDISNLNACICSHNAVDSWDFFPYSYVSGTNQGKIFTGPI
jgi:hypothetical protein